MIYIDGETRMSQVAAVRVTVSGLIHELLRAGTGREAGMSRDQRTQSDSISVRVPAGTGSTATGKVTLTQPRVELGASATADAPTVQRKLAQDASEPPANAATPRPSSGLASLFGRPRREAVVPVQRQASSPSEPAAVSQVPALEGALLLTRLEAVKKGLQSKASCDASLALSRTMAQLQPAVAAKGAVDVGVQVQAALAAQRLFIGADAASYRRLPTRDLPERSRAVSW
jgi:hypothetical protein